MIKQEHKEFNGVRYNVCPKCKEIVRYPEGIYCRNGVEVHTSCVAVLRMTRGKIKGIDC